MSRKPQELMEYKHQQLMDELNELFMDIKTHLYGIPVARPKPTVQEVDSMFFRTIRALKEIAKPMRRY